MKKLDAKDKEILTHLQKDSKMSSRKLAKKLGMPVSTLCKRIRSLEDSGVIEGYKPILNLGKVGFPSVAYIMVSFDPARPGNTQTEPEFLKHLARNPRVLEADIVTGECDILLKVYGSSEREIGMYVVEELRQIKGLAKATTMLVTYEEKTNGSIYLGLKDKVPR